MPEVSQDAGGNFRFPAELDSSRNRFSFTGYLFDRETNFFFAKARFYDPQVGRFTSQDSFRGSIDDPPSLHRYFYGNTNPARFIDPTGHQAEGVNPPITQEEVNASLAQDLAASRQRRLTMEAAASGAPTPAVVDEDHGPLGNLGIGAAKWLGQTRIGRSVRKAFSHAADQVEAASKKASTATSSAVSEALKPAEQGAFAGRAEAAKALTPEELARVGGGAAPGAPTSRAAFKRQRRKAPARPPRWARESSSSPWPRRPRARCWGGCTAGQRRRAMRMMPRRRRVMSYLRPEARD